VASAVQPAGASDPARVPSGMTGRRWLAALALASIAIVAATAVRWRGASAASSAPAALVDGVAPRGISCLGRIEPEDGVITIGARSLSGQPSIVQRLLVKEGDAIASGQVLGLLDSHDELQAVVAQADARLRLAQARLQQVRAGAKSADIAAQRADIARLEKEAANAHLEYDRTRQLVAAQVVSQSALDASRLAADAQVQRLEQARQRLVSLDEVRSVDINVAEQEVGAAQADLQRARAELARAFIRSPTDGHVLTIAAWPGEEVGPDGLMTVARTGRMYVFAEVPEDDVRRLSVGQRAVVRAESLPAPLGGIIDHLGSVVTKNTTLPVDPAAFSDARIVEVKVRLDEAAVARRLIHGRVSVVFTPAP
jgi:HlyD family secretion protein